MSSQLLRDSQAFRAHMDYQQRLAKIDKKPKEKSGGTMDQILREWAQTETVATTYRPKVERVEIDVPEDPFLSVTRQASAPTAADARNAVSQLSGEQDRSQLSTTQNPGKLPQLLQSTVRKSQLTTLEKYQFEMQGRRTEAVLELTEYVRSMLVASYEDLSRDRSQIQYQLSQFEQTYQKMIDTEELSPPQLVQQLYAIRQETQNFLQTFQKQIGERLAGLEEAAKRGTTDAVRRLTKANLTKEQIEQSLEAPVFQLNQELSLLQQQLRGLLQCSEERTNALDEDFTAKARRQIVYRRKNAQQQLLQDYKDFVLAQEWSESIVEALQQCQCAHQLIARDVFDTLEKITRPERAGAFMLVEQFLKSRAVALRSLDALKDTFLGVKSNLESSLAETAAALQEITMPGCENLKAMLQNWAGRWEKRIEVVHKQSDALIHVNGYYVVSFVALIGAVEQSRLNIQVQDKTLTKALEQVQAAVEERFVRDQTRFNTTLLDIHTRFAEIWDPRKATTLANQTESLISAMEKAAVTRQDLLERIFVGDDSATVLSAQSLLKMQLEELASLMGLAQTQITWQQFMATGSEVCKKGDVEIETTSLNQIAKEREIDLQVSGASQQIGASGTLDATQAAKSTQRPPSANSNGPKSRSGSAKVQSVSKAGKKGVQDSQASGGLLIQLPSFEDIDLNEYEVKFGFSLCKDGVLPEPYREQLQTLFGDEKSKKQANPKKGKDAPEGPSGLRWAEQGAELREIGEVKLQILKDLRPLLNFVVLQFMREEGKRLAYNKAIDDFKEQLRVWREQYLQALSQGEITRHKQQAEAHAKQLKEWEKKQKAAKGKAFTEPQPEAPAPPVLAEALPDAVQLQLDLVRIPPYMEKKQDTPYLDLIFRIMGAEELTRIPDFDAIYETPVSEILFFDQPALEEGLDTSKSGQAKKKSRQKERVVQEEEPNVAKGPKLPDPPKSLSKFWEDHRLVTHGGANCFSLVLNKFLCSEISQLQSKYVKIQEFYTAEGERVRRRTAADLAALRMELLSHRTKYVQNLPLQIQAEFAKRNATTQREIERVARRCGEIYLQFSDTDVRFQGFSKIYQKKVEPSSRPPSGNALETSSRDGMKRSGTPAAPAKEKKAGDSNPQVDTILQKFKAAQFVRFQFNQQTGQIQQIAVQDIFGQTHATFRNLTAEFDAWFIQRLHYDKPATLGRQLVYAQDAFLAHAQQKMALLYRTRIFQPLENIQKELEIAKQRALKWGAASNASDFSFIDETVKLLTVSDKPAEKVEEKPAPQEKQDKSGKKEQKKAVQSQPENQDPAHPSVGIYSVLQGQLQMMREDMYSRYNTDVSAFRKLVKAASEACKQGNQTQIIQNQKKQLASRDTNRIQTVIMGRLTTIRQDVEEIETALDSFQTVFMKEAVVATQNSTGSQASLLSSINASKQQKKAEPKICFKLQENATAKIVEFIELSLRLEFCFYLVGYDRGLEATVFKTPQHYQAGYEQYQQRQKAFFNIFGLFLAHVWSLEKITFGRDLNVKQLQQRLQNLTAAKNYLSKGRVYMNQSSIDLMTQFQAEYQLMLQKLQGADVSTPLEESQCTTDVDWAVFSLQQMGRRLGKEHAELQTKIRDCLIRRDNVLSQLLTNYNTYLGDFFREVSAQKLSEAVQEARSLQEDFLTQFRTFYDKLRPVLSQMPERRAALIQEADAYAAEILKRHEQNTQKQMTLLTNQLRLMCTGVLFTPTLYALNPQVGAEIPVSLQLCALSDLRQVASKDRPTTPGKRPDSRSQTSSKLAQKGKKDAAADAQQAGAQIGTFKPAPVFSDVEIAKIVESEAQVQSQPEAKGAAAKDAKKKAQPQEDEQVSFPASLQKAVTLIQTSMENAQILFNLNDYDPKTITATTASKTIPSFMVAPVSNTHIETLQNIDSLELSRTPAAVSRPQSRGPQKDTKKPAANAPPPGDEPLLPTLVQLPIVSVQLQAWDEETFQELQKVFDFRPRAKLSGISCADKLSATAFLDAAGATFKIADKIVAQIAEFKAEAQRVQGTLETVAAELHGALIKLGPAEEAPKPAAAEPKGKSKK